MIIEGHFAETRAKHYTHRDLEELRELYRWAYPFIALSPNDHCERIDPQDWRLRLSDLQVKLARQNIMEAKLVVLEDRIDRLKDSH